LGRPTTGTATRAEITLGSAPSHAAATTTQSGSKARISSRGAARRWIPATPTSWKLSTVTPISPGHGDRFLEDGKI
jgi:hypothetical protein